MNFSYFDIVSPNITLYYKNNRKHSSLFSKIFSIVIIMFLLILSMYFSIDFVFKKNPYSYYYNRFITDTGIFPLNSSSMFHFISFENSSIWDKNAFSLIGVRVSESNYILIKDINDFDFWIYEKCDVSDAGIKYKYLVNYTKEFKNGLCIKKFYNSTEKQVYNIYDKNFHYPTLEHGASNPNEKFYGLFIQRCLPKKKSFFNVSDCYNTSYSDELMMNGSMYSIYFVDQNVDIENYKNPLDFYFHKISNRLSTTSYTKNVLNFHSGEIKTRTGIIFEQISYIKTYIYDANEKVVSEKNEKNNNEEIYGAFYFSMQNMLNVYDRKYKRLQEVSANIGGIVKLIMILSKMINYFFYKYCIIKDLDDDMQLKYKKAGEIFEGNKFIKYLRMNTQLKLTNITNINNKTIKNNNYIDNKNDKKKIKKNNNSSLNIMNFENKFDILKKKKKKVLIMDNDSHSNSYNTINLKSKSFNNQQINKFLNKKLTITTNSNENSLFFYTFKSFLCCFNKNDHIHYLINFKKKILSEEEIFTHHFLLKSLRKAIFEKNINKNGFKIDYRDNDLSNNNSDFSPINSKNIH